MSSFVLLLLIFQAPKLKTGTALDYIIPPKFTITGKAVAGLDEPVMVNLHLTEVYSGVTYSTESFANGSFRFNNVLLGTYRVTVTNPGFNLYDQQVLLREPEDAANVITVRLVRNGESPSPPALDSSLYEIDAETAKAVPAKAVEEYNKGVAALRNPDRQNLAYGHFKNAIAAAPTFYEAHLQLGLVFRREDQKTEAIRELENASTLKPKESRPLSLLGELYWQTDRYDETVDRLSKLITLAKISPRDHYYLGSAFYRLGKLDKAEEELLAAINTGNNTDPEPFLQLHNVFIRTKQPVRALAVLEDYLKTFPNDVNHPAMAERAKAMRQALKLPPGK